jgi:hypothetical protein
VVGLTERCTDDAIVSLIGIKSVFIEEVFLNTVDFNVDGGVVASFAITWMYPNGMSERPASLHADLFKTAQCGASGATDIVGSTFETVQFFNDCKGNDDIAIGKRQ